MGSLRSQVRALVQQFCRHLGAVAHDQPAAKRGLAHKVVRPVHQPLVKAAATGELIERLRQQLLRVDPTERALARLAATARGSDCVYDVYILHC